jgi:pyruvate/2-oxoglutarate dehydrogenase complex dihydrolipoamide dehydrogenase (E3) component
LRHETAKTKEEKKKKKSESSLARSKSFIEHLWLHKFTYDRKMVKNKNTVERQQQQQQQQQQKKKKEEEEEEGIKVDKQKIKIYNSRNESELEIDACLLACVQQSLIVSLGQLGTRKRSRKGS